MNDFDAVLDGTRESARCAFCKSKHWFTFDARRLRWIGDCGYGINGTGDEIEKNLAALHRRMFTPEGYSRIGPQRFEEER